MRSLPLIIVVGANDLALRVCEELCATSGHEVVVLWEPHPQAEGAVRAMGATFCGHPPNDYTSLDVVGVRDAACIIPVSEDDRLNLQVALKARDLNPDIRVVLRQFNRALGRKIEQNLPNCTAISPATHAAATYAAAAVDPACVYAVQFPALSGPLVGFSERRAHDFGLDDCTVAEAERRLGVRVVAVNGRIAPEAPDTIRREDTVVACGPMLPLQECWPRRNGAAKKRGRARTSMRDLLRGATRVDSLLVYTFAIGTFVYFLASAYFAYDLHLTFLEALYFVATTMFTVGYGDITPLARHGGWGSLVAGIVIMGVGVTLGGVFIATITSALNRAQQIALRGLRHIRAEDHIVVCGAGNVGTRIIDFLLEMGQHVVVIEPRPSALVVENARARRIELLASDATDDQVLAFCDLAHAQTLVAATDSDTANLEAALGALAYGSDLHLVMRIHDPQFSRSVARNFRIGKSFSASDLTAPAIAGLARFPASRGRVSFAGETFNVGERTTHMHIPRAEGGIPLYFWRDGALVAAHDFGDMQPNDRVLDIVPLSQFKAV
ncbi:MAG TPA: NAD-binding protein [Candidatus Baltobacteraceae bacterium]|jgi:Trk K+ transport system NAD-binding subunit|nr:NAD-binding protein [Candidatus Baltobacteraceae bacterium]